MYLLEVVELFLLLTNYCPVLTRRRSWLMQTHPFGCSIRFFRMGIFGSCLMEAVQTSLSIPISGAHADISNDPELVEENLLFLSVIEPWMSEGSFSREPDLFKKFSHEQRDSDNGIDVTKLTHTQI